MIEAAKASNVMMSVFHNRRWDGDYLTVDGVLGIVAVGRADFALELGAPPEEGAR